MTKIKEYDFLSLRLPKGAKNLLKMQALRENLPLYKWLLKKADIDVNYKKMIARP